MKFETILNSVESDVIDSIAGGQFAQFTQLDERRKFLDRLANSTGKSGPDVNYYIITALTDNSVGNWDIYI